MFKNLQDMALFALVVECGSFTAAAQRAGLPKSSVSQRLSQLEQQLGLRLLNRTTRQLNLTFAGERYLVHCQAMIQAAEQAALSLQPLRDNPSGRLRISSPAGLGATLLPQLALDFRQLYPEVSLEISVSDSLVDLVHESVDASFRTGKPQDSSLIGRHIGIAPRYLVASPAYLAQHAAITHPQQLMQHSCITHSAWPEWVLRHDDSHYRWSLPLTHCSDNLPYALECALLGGGITLLPAFFCRQQVEAGLLQVVLPQWEAQGNEMYLVYPSRKLNSPALVCFIEMVMQHPLLAAYIRPIATNG